MTKIYYGAWHPQIFCGKCSYELGRPDFDKISWTRKNHPYCPGCGSKAYNYYQKIMRYCRVGWFGKGYWEEKKEISDGTI